MLRKLFLAAALFLPVFAQAATMDVTQPPYNATGDGTTDDTVAIQAALDAAGASGFAGSPSTVLFPAGMTFFVPGVPGVKIPSNTTLDLRGATLIQGPNKGGSGQLGRNRVLETVVGAENVTVLGGTLIGSRPYVGGTQWSIGLRVDSATNVLVEGTVFLDWYTDGVYIGGNPPGSTNVTFRNIRVSNSMRNGLSIACATTVRIERSIFETTNCNQGGTVTCTAGELNMPMCGIDWEPNAGDIINDIRVTDSIFRYNQKCGMFIQSGNGGAGARVVIDGNRFEGNGTHGLIANQMSRATIINNFVSGGTIGYSFGAGLRDLIAADNEVTATSGNGINFAGVFDPIVARFKVNSRPVFYVAITSPLVMNAVAGEVNIRPFQ